ncbi:MAG: SAM-dependent methyltransferase [Planctomycetota bacterium]|jgi:SAM-dependent methyltransferase
MDIYEINRDGWDQRVLDGDIWTRPVTAEQVLAAQRGDWSIVLTSSKEVPHEWFGDLAKKRVLALASGGGQQGPIMAAAGAQVVVFDASPQQLANDAVVAEEHELDLKTVQGFMHDLSAFPDGSFDLVFHPVSNCFTPEVLPVWREAFRILKPGGHLLAGFMNPDSYIFDQFAEDRGEIVVRFPLPYSDLGSLPPEELERAREEYQTLEHSHSWQDQIGGQLKAGFHLIGMYEDAEPNRPVARYIPDTMATLAQKPK